MPDRRAFLAGMLATGLCPRTSWADAGNPRYLSAARNRNGTYSVCGIRQDGDVVFEIPLAGRGHAAAAHPTKPLAVAFARRPGTFALVLDCVSGEERAQLIAPEGRHFYGHGAFSEDGELLFTAENDFEAARGVVGVWEARTGFTRIDEFPSGGVGPHDIKLLPRGKGLVVANGGIETHPEMGRAKLNLPNMRPNLACIDLSTRQADVIALAPDLHKNSIRHLAVNASGDVAFAMQWQGDVVETPPILGRLSAAGKTDLLRSSDRDTHARMQGYAGSVSFSADGGRIAITSPRGGRAQIFDSKDGAFIQEVPLADTCGVAPHARGFVLTSGNGDFCVVQDGVITSRTRHDMQWDNHLVTLTSGGALGPA